MKSNTRKTQSGSSDELVLIVAAWRAFVEYSHD